MVLVGKVNKSLVSLINQAGGSAVGMSGKARAGRSPPLPAAPHLASRPQRGGGGGGRTGGF